MKTKHTPGPWHIEGQITATDEGLLHSVIRDKNHRWTALVEAEDEEGIANAKLIAAAPDLLEALQRFVVFADSQKIEYESAMVRQCKEAIKKATE